MEIKTSKFLAGSLAGLAATAAMTLAMESMYRRLPGKDRYPLPPREITSKLAGDAGSRTLASERRRVAATLAAHFGFGAIMGGLYPLLLRGRPRAPGTQGALYGVAVWIVSYLGWIPALGILRPATQHPPRRNALMIAAHVVWGGTLGLIANRVGPLRANGRKGS